MSELAEYPESSCGWKMAALSDEGSDMEVSDAEGSDVESLNANEAGYDGSLAELHNLIDLEEEGSPATEPELQDLQDHPEGSPVPGAERQSLSESSPDQQKNPERPPGTATTEPELKNPPSSSAGCQEERDVVKRVTRDETSAASEAGTGGESPGEDGVARGDGRGAEETPEEPETPPADEDVISLGRCGVTAPAETQPPSAADERSAGEKDEKEGEGHLVVQRRRWKDGSSSSCKAAEPKMPPPPEEAEPVATTPDHKAVQSQDRTEEEEEEEALPVHRDAPPRHQDTKMWRRRAAVAWSLAACTVLVLILVAAVFQVRLHASSNLQEQKDDLAARLDEERERWTNENMVLKKSLEWKRVSLLALHDDMKALRSQLAQLQEEHGALLLDNQRLSDEAERERAVAEQLRAELDGQLSGSGSSRTAGEEGEEPRPSSPSSSSSSDGEELQSRLAELEKRLSFEQQRSDMWERLYVQTKQTQTT